MIKYDYYNRTEPSKIYLSKPSKRVYCALNSIDEDSVNMTLNLNDTSTIEFDVCQYVNNEETGELELSNGYDLLGRFMEIYVDGYGWFKMQEPTVNHDGKKEYKSITADSLEIELQQYDLVNFTINYGYDYSKEMLADNNTTVIDGYTLPKENIKFYNENNKQLSLLNLILEETPWEVGFVDEYTDDVLTTQLKDQVYRFDVDTQDVYSFLCQDVAGAYNCVFMFDTNSKRVNAYRVESIGKDTNIMLGFRNVQNEVTTTVDEDSIYTVFQVAGGDDLNINYVNYGSSIIWNYDHFLTEKYMPQDMITKYKDWMKLRNDLREEYIGNSKGYNNQLEIITELTDRVPNDAVSNDWASFSDADLLEEKSNYEAQLLGYEQLYVDGYGNFDENALRDSSDWNDYWCIKYCILPDIEIEQNNRLLDNPDDVQDYIDDWETNWDLFGLDELNAKLEVYNDAIALAHDKGYNVPWSASSTYSNEWHTQMYNNYLINVEYQSGCLDAIYERQSQIDFYTELMNEYQSNRTSIAEQVNRDTYTHPTLGRFTDEEIGILMALWNKTDYQNDNILTTSLDNTVSTVDIQYELFTEAEEELSIESQPQYQYDTTQDNVLALADYQEYHTEFQLANFLHIGLDDETFVRLRLSSIGFNPMVLDNNLDLVFTSMLTSKSKRNDFASLLDSAVKSAKNKISASYYKQNTDDNATITLSNSLIKAIVNSNIFNNATDGLVGSSSVNLDGYLKTDNLSSAISNLGSISIDSAFMKYLSANLITATHVTADDIKSLVITAINASIEDATIDSAKIGDLSVGNMQANIISAINSYEGTAKIKTALIDTASLGSATIVDGSITNAKIADGAITNAKIEDATIESAKIKSLNANVINSGILNTGLVDISSTDGTMLMQNNTLTIKDNQTVPQVRTQLGLNAQGGYGLIVLNANGTTIFDSDYGVMCEDGLNNNIVSTDKIIDNAVDSTKLNVDELFVGDNAFINSLNAVEINASNITTGIISNEHIDINGLVSFDAFDETLRPLFSTVDNVTYINGGMLATGSIKANSIDLLSGLTVYGQNNMPTFSISDTGEVEVDGLLHSSNYDTDKNTGYEIRTDGTATFNSIVARGDIISPKAGITSSGTHDTDVRFYAGANFENRANAPFRVLQNGNTFMTNSVISGTMFGSLDNDDLTINNGSLIIGGNNSEIDDVGNITTVNNGDIVVDINKDSAMFNTDIIFGTQDNQLMMFSKSNKTLSNNVKNIYNNKFGTIVENDNDNNDFIPIAINTDYGSSTSMYFDSNGGGMVFNNTGSNTNSSDDSEYDFKFTRKKDSENVRVKIQGTLDIGTNINSSKNNIQFRSCDDGWGFYLN